MTSGTPVAGGLYGSCGHVQRDARGAQEERESGKRPGQPYGGAGTHPTRSSSAFAYSFCHDATL